MAVSLRLAIRNLVRNPRFSLVAVLTLAVGIGTATAIFSVCDFALFRGYKSPPDLYAIGGRNDQMPFSDSRFEYQVRAYEQQKAAFSEYSKSAYFSGNVVLNGEPVTTSWRGIDANLLPLLGVKPLLGRNFLPEECQDGRDEVVMINHDFWKRNFDGGADVLGKQIRVGTSLCTIVGVLPAEFPNYVYAEVYRPLVFRADPKDPGRTQYNVLGRLRPGVTLAQALATLESLKLDQPAELKWWVTNDHPLVISIAELTTFEHRDVYWMMIAAVGLLYAIACLNTANLSLIRMLGQRREYSIRLALGSSRKRILGHLALDSFLINGAACILGVGLANVLLPSLLAATSNAIFGAKWTEWNVSWRALGVLGGLSFLSAGLIVILPAVRLFRGDLQVGLKDGGTVTGESPVLGRLRGFFVIVQAALAVILLSGAGLMVQTFKRLQHVDIGFDPIGKAKMFMDYPPQYPADSKTRLDLLRRIQNELIHIPGIKAAAFGSDLLLSGNYFGSQEVEGPDGKKLRLALSGFSSDFPEVAGITLTQGAWLKSTSKNEILINESLAKTLFPGKNAVGQLVRPVSAWIAPKDRTGWQVAGVVHDLPESLRRPAGLYIYSSETWSPAGFYCFVMRLSQPLNGALQARIRKQIYKFDPNLIISYMTSLEDTRASNLWAENLANVVLEILALIALALTVVGIYSVLAFTVDRRMNEFGVRIALGATRSNLIALVARRSIALTLTGLALGIVVSFYLGRIIQSLLFQTSPQDPGVVVMVCALTLLASTLACIWPCRRAAATEVTHLLRSQ